MITLPDDMPATIAVLPRDERGYPIPWFVKWIDGKPEFRVGDARKIDIAVAENLCWVCGQMMAGNLTFLIGPMCVVNRNTAEPPCHYSCAKFSAQVCPFLSKPAAKRREANLPKGTQVPGLSLEHNPGAQALFTCKNYQLDDGMQATGRIPHGRQGFLFKLPNPVAVEWWACGRKANRVEVLEALMKGKKALDEFIDSRGARRELNAKLDEVYKTLPKK